jgi:metallophosphoesterase superfamily enzyme
VSRWRGTLEAELCLVPGNHDAAAARVVGAWGIRLLEAVHEAGGLTLTHVPPPGLVERAHVAGHVHPALSVRTGRGPGKVACFHVCGGEECGGRNGGGTLVLPAFSRFTGGVSVRRVRGERLFAATDEGVLEA